MIRDAAAIAQALSRGETTSRQLTAEALSLVEQRNGEWHVFITTLAESALREAAASDGRRAAGQTLGPLDGIPVAIKDNIDIAGTATSGGSAFYADQIKDKDAHVVALLRRAGAVILGKVNLHEGALGATTDNPFFGRCANPAVAGATPGGSSGGSAAAVAGGFVPVALGTDTMGSVRIPAAYCGLWGLKPTKGLVGSAGLFHLSWTLDTIGPLASTPEDLALVLSVIAGHDRDDPDSASIPQGWNAQITACNPAGLRLAVPAAIASVECEPAVRGAFGRLTAAARHSGADVHEIALESWHPTQARRAGLLASEAEIGSLIGEDLDRGGAGFSDEFRAMVNYGRSMRAERLADAYRQMQRVRHDVLAALEKVDALLMPTTPHMAFPHGKPAPVSQADFTALANICGCPAVAFPLPAGVGQAPVSAQVVGRPFSEGRLLGIAKALGQVAA